jgi:hypothetical protein
MFITVILAMLMIPACFILVALSNRDSDISA